MTALVVSLGVASSAAAGEPAADMGEASASFSEAERRLAAGDPDGAITRFAAGLELLPQEPGYAPTRARVLLLIVDAHEAAFAVDGELERLRRAGALLDRYLGPLELLDEQGRAAAEERRVRLIASIAAVEARLRAEASARALAARRARAQSIRQKARVLSSSGAVLTSVGIAGLAVMAAGIGLGVDTDGKIEALKISKNWSSTCLSLDPSCRDERRAELDPLLARGNRGNTMMIAGGVSGGVLLITGITLLVLGSKQQRDARLLAVVPIPTATASSLGLRFQGRF